MTKTTKTKSKESKVFTLAERNILKVSVFKDEYEKLGLTENMPVNEAVTLVRAKLELPKRFKQGSEKSKLRTALKDISDEKLHKLLAIVEAEE